MKRFIILVLFIVGTTTAFAQTKHSKSKKKNNSTTAKVTYTCSMHPEVVSSKPGKCSKCGMALNLSPKEKMKMEVMKIYTCPMGCEGDTAYDKPGKCPVCGMDLQLKKDKKN